MYSVYILELEGKKRFYVGFTEDLERRLLEHKNGNVTSTRKRLVKLIYCEQFSIKKEAMKREKWLKSGVGRKWIEENVL